MAIEGSLADVGLADICQLLAMGRKTGCLSVTHRSNFGYVYFGEGRVTHASVLNRPDRLGDLLVKNGVIERSDLDEAIAAQVAESGKRLGQILVERGTITREDLNRFITIQIEEAVYHLFAWNEGGFHFNPDQLPDEDPTLKISINTEGLLLEGARRVDEWSQIEKKIPSMDIVFSLERHPEEEEGVELTEAQKKILPLIDGDQTVDDLVKESGLVEFDVAKALYGLLQAGFLQRSGRRAPRDREEDTLSQQHSNLGVAFFRAGMLEDSEREFKRALELDPTDPKLRSRLALVCLKRHRPVEALEYFDGAPLETKPDFAGLRNRALALEWLGRYDEALESLERADALRPGDADTLLARGIVHLKGGDAESAQSALERYRRYLQDTVPPPLFFAYALLTAAALGDLEGAVQFGRDGMEHYPNDGPILVNLGTVLERRGEAEPAEELYRRALQDSPVLPQAHKNLGEMAYRRGERDEAKKHFQKAIELNSHLGDDVYLKLGNIAEAEEDREWALRLWRRALEMNPDNAVVREKLSALAPAPG
ncbi:MAG: DUF4388 domain-containing protein [Gemmatimonadota bacterium]